MCAKQEYKSSGFVLCILFLLLVVYSLLFLAWYSLSVGGQNKGEQLQYEIMLCMCYPPGPSALFLLLSASLHRSRNGSPGRGKESSVGGKNVSEPECWERQDVSNCGLIAGFLYYSFEAQPTHRKCTLG